VETNPVKEIDTKIFDLKKYKDKLIDIKRKHA